MSFYKIKYNVTVSPNRQPIGNYIDMCIVFTICTRIHLMAAVFCFYLFIFFFIYLFILFIFYFMFFFGGLGNL
jgi:hypothetical protein